MTTDPTDATATDPAATDAPDVTAAAYRHCEEVVRREARNFSYGIRLLHPAERNALSAVYAMARRIDDIGDSTGPVATRLTALADVRASLHRLEAARAPLVASPGSIATENPATETPAAATPATETPATPAAPDLVLVALGHAAARYGLPIAAFDDLIDGCVADVEGRTYEEDADTVAYCRLVAGSVGRLSLAVFLGPVEERGAAGRSSSGAPAELEALADDLGVALQLTNILRDVDEDRRLGRAYLPRSAAVAAGCRPELDGPPEALRALLLTYCDEADHWFERGLGLLPHLDGRSRACVGAMAGIYHRLLVRIRRDPLAVTRGRLSLPAWEKAWVAARAISGGRP